MRYKVVLYADPQTEMELVRRCEAYIEERVQAVNPERSRQGWIVLHVVPPLHIETKPGQYIRDASCVLVRKKDASIIDLYEEAGIPSYIIKTSQPEKAQEVILALEPPPEVLPA